MVDTSVRKILLGDKYIGEIRDDVFVKRVQGSRHLLKRPKAIAIDKGIVERIRYEVNVIEVVDLESEVTYRTSMKQFLEKSIFIDRKYGEQLALPLQYWTKEMPGQTRMLE